MIVEYFRMGVYWVEEDIGLRLRKEWSYIEEVEVVVWYVVFFCSSVLGNFLLR